MKTINNNMMKMLRTQLLNVVENLLFILKY